MDAQDFSWDERRLGAVSQSFSKADSHRLLLPKPIPLQPNAYYMISAIIKARSSTPNTFNGVFTPLALSGGWPRLAGGGQHKCQASCPRLVGSRLDLASPARGRIRAGLDCSLSADAPYLLGRKACDNDNKNTVVPCHTTLGCRGVLDSYGRLSCVR